MATLAERIEAMSIPEPNTGCWLWLGSISHLGYGRMSFNGKVRGAHRLSWSAYRGRRYGLHVLHRCDVRCCVNPDHLFLGTRSDNMQDMHNKGRHPGNGQRGANHSRAKLTEDQAREIRLSAPFTRGLAKKFGVSNSRISAIRNGQSWGHLK